VLTKVNILVLRQSIQLKLCISSATLIEELKTYLRIEELETYFESEFTQEVASTTLDDLKNPIYLDCGFTR
jgi:hypothetical protein